MTPRVSVSLGEPLDNLKASVQDFLTVFKIYSDEFLIVTTKRLATAVKTFRTGWYFESRGRVLFEDRKIQNLKSFQPAKKLTHPGAPERQANLVRDDCSGVRHQLLDEAAMALFIHGKRSNRRVELTSRRDLTNASSDQSSYETLSRYIGTRVQRFDVSFHLIHWFVPTISSIRLSNLVSPFG